MRPLLLSSLLAIGAWCTSAETRAQLLEQTDARSYETCYDAALPIGGGRWALVGKMHFGAGHLISVRNADGSIDWEDISEFGVGLGLGTMALMPDSGLLHAGGADYCDVFGYPVRMRRYAADGTLLWEQVLMDETGPPPPFLLAKGISTSIAVGNEYETRLLSLDGDPLAAWPTPVTVPFSSLSMLHWMGEEALCLAHGNQTLRLVSITGSTLATAVVGNGLTDLHYDGNALHALRSSEVRVYDAALNHTGTIALPAGETGLALHGTPDGTYVSTNVGLHRITGLTLESLFVWPALPNAVSHGVTVRNGAVLSAGYCHVGSPYQFWNGLFRTFDLSGAAAIHDEDVEALLSIDSTWTEWLTPQYIRRKANMTIRVVNHGSAPLTSVAVSSKSEAPWFACEQAGLHVQLTGLSVAPGDTLLAWSGTHIVNLGGYPWQGVANVQVCAAATSPNGKADRHPDDNYACGSASFVVGMAEHARIALSIAPNPAQGQCIIRGLSALGPSARFTLLDASGRAVRLPATRRMDDDEALLDLSGVAPGSYTVQVQGAAGSAVRRLLVER